MFGFHLEIQPVETELTIYPEETFLLVALKSLVAIALIFPVSTFWKFMIS